MTNFESSLSSLSSSTGSHSEDDWDNSFILDSSSCSTSTSIQSGTANSIPFIAQVHAVINTPRNSIVFPADETPGRTSRYSSLTKEDQFKPGKGGNRTLSQLLKLHSEKGSNGDFTPEEANRIADVLGQWINACSSPYEAEDDFFTRTAQDDLSLAPKRPMSVSVDAAGRPRGRSESVARSVYHSSSAGHTASKPSGLSSS